MNIEIEKSKDLEMRSDLNSVLIEGCIVNIIPLECENADNVTLEICSQYCSRTNRADKTLTFIRVNMDNINLTGDVSKLLGRSVRIVGRISCLSTKELFIIAEHYELKPSPALAS